MSGFQYMTTLNVNKFSFILNIVYMKDIIIK